MNPQTNPTTPATAADQTAPKPRERGLERVDVRPVLHRLNGMVGKPWSVVLGKINGLYEMRYDVTRAAYLRCVGENVGADMPYHVDENGCLARREEAGTDKVVEPVVLSAETKVFLDGRVVGMRGTVLVWFVRTGRSYQVPNGTDPETGKPAFKAIDYFRQDRPLNKKETATFDDLDRAVRDAILAQAPASSPSPAN